VREQSEAPGVEAIPSLCPTPHRSVDRPGFNEQLIDESESTPGGIRIPNLLIRSKALRAPTRASCELFWALMLQDAHSLTPQ